MVSECGFESCILKHLLYSFYNIERKLYNNQLVWSYGTSTRTTLIGPFQLSELFFDIKESSKDIPLPLI